MDTTLPLDNAVARSMARKHTVGACSWRRLRLFERLGDDRYDYDMTAAGVADWALIREKRQRLDAGELSDEPTPYEAERARCRDTVVALCLYDLVQYQETTRQRLEDGWQLMHEQGEDDTWFAAWSRLLARHEVACDELEARRGA